MGNNLARIQMGDVSEVSSLITIDEIAHTTKDQSVFREPPPIPQTPPQSSEDRIFPKRSTRSDVKAKDALECISTLNGEDDVGVEEFIHEIQEIRIMCSEQTLLKMIKTKKIVGKAAMAIRNIRITEFETLYKALRRNVSYSSISERTPKRTMEMEIQQVVFENCLIVVSRS